MKRAMIPMSLLSAVTLLIATACGGGTTTTVESPETLDPPAMEPAAGEVPAPPPGGEVEIEQETPHGDYETEIETDYD